MGGVRVVAIGNIAHAAAGTVPYLQLWSLETGCDTHVLLGHHAAVQAVAFNVDSAFLASADAHGLVKVGQETTSRGWGRGCD